MIGNKSKSVGKKATYIRKNDARIVIQQKPNGKLEVLGIAYRGNLKDMAAFALAMKQDYGLTINPNTY